MKIELITWKDAGGEESGWLSAEEVDDENPIIRSVGWVVKETENNVTLAMDHNTSDETTHSRGRIPKGMIVSRQELCIN